MDTVLKALPHSTEQSKVRRERGLRGLWHCVRVLGPSHGDSLTNKQTNQNKLKQTDWSTAWVLLARGP